MRLKIFNTSVLIDIYLKLQNAQLFLGFVSILTLFCYCVPVMLQWKLSKGADNETYPIRSAMNSSEFELSLVVSLSMSVPMIFELIVRILLNSRIKLSNRMIASNISILLSLIVPDTLILFYAIPHEDLNFVGFIIKARIICISWAALSLILQHCGSRWSSKWSCIFHVLVCISSLPDVYNVYINFENLLLLQILFTVIQSLAVIISFLIMVKLSYNWYRYILSQSTMKEISTDQYLCTVYISAFIICGLGLYGNYFSHMSEVQWYNFDKTNLVVHTLMFTVFYIIIVVFENRGLQREIVMTQVTRRFHEYHHNSLYIYILSES